MRGFELERDRMITRHLEPRGISDARVLGAFRRVPRDRFVPPESRARACEDCALPLPSGQTISQPYVVATMAQALALQPTDRVLEIGAGCGYAAAILGCLAGEVWTVERVPELAELAMSNLREAGEFAHVHVVCADGTLGLPEHAPYQGISVAAAAASIPPALEEQLAEGGRLVIPVGATDEIQSLLEVVKRRDGTFYTEVLETVRFVPLIGSDLR